MRRGRNILNGDRLLLSAKEAAAVLGIDRRTLWRWTMPRGDLPCVRKGRLHYYSRATIEQWISDSERATSEQATG